MCNIPPAVIYYISHQYQNQPVPHSTMSEYHQIQLIKDGTILSQSEYKIIRCPYSKVDNRYGYIDSDGYFLCKNNYCEESACTFFHTSDRDCIQDKLDQGTWDDWEMWQFEEDFCDLDWEIDDNCEEWISLYHLLKTNDCKISDKTHDHYKTLLESKPEDIVIDDAINHECSQCDELDEIDGRNGFTPEGVPIPDWYNNGYNSADWEAWCNMYGPKQPPTPPESDWISNVHGQ